MRKTDTVIITLNVARKRTKQQNVAKNTNGQLFQNLGPCSANDSSCFGLDEIKIGFERLNVLEDRSRAHF